MLPLQLISASDCSLAEAVASCTIHPCRCFGLGEGCGRLEPGAPAHVVQFRWQTEERRLSIEQTIRSGRVVYEAAAQGEGS